MCNIPSQCTHEEWLWTFNENPEEYRVQSQEFIKNPQNAGRWLIFRNKEYVDSLWNIIRTQTKLGKLGLAAEASSRAHADVYSKKGSHVIAVYTPDFRDKRQVLRVRENLRTLGVEGKIRYTKLNLAKQDGKDGTALTIYYV